MSAYSEYTTNGESVSSYQQSQCGPFGTRLNDMIQRSAEYNVPFDQLQYEEAKLDGCMKEPCASYPTWPPSKETGFIYPSLSKANQYQLQGQNLGPMVESTPYVVQPETTTETQTFENQYSPEDILNMNPCQDPNQYLDPALPGMCVGALPFDATYQSMNTQGRYMDGIAPEDMMYRPRGEKTQTGPVHEHFSNADGGEDQMHILSTPPMQMDRHNITAEHHPPNRARPSQNPIPPVLVGNPPSPSLQAHAQQTLKMPPYAAKINEEDENENENEVNTSSSSSSPPLYSLQEMPSRMSNTIKGIMYDFSCWDDLPPTENRVRWVLTRDDRWFFLLMWIMLFLVFYYVMRIVWMIAFPSPRASTQASVACWLGTGALIAYLLLPTVKGTANVQKMVSLLVIVMVLFMFFGVPSSSSSSSRESRKSPITQISAKTFQDNVFF